jgi:hypothetical protein
MIYVLSRFISGSLQSFKRTCSPYFMEKKVEWQVWDQELKAAWAIGWTNQNTEKPQSSKHVSNFVLCLSLSLLFPFPTLLGNHLTLDIPVHANYDGRVGLNCSSKSKWNLSVFIRGHQMWDLQNVFCTVLGNRFSGQSLEWVEDNSGSLPFPS